MLTDKTKKELDITIGAVCTVVQDKANWLINKDNNIGHGAEFTSGEESLAKTISALAELVSARAQRG